MKIKFLTLIRESVVRAIRSVKGSIFPNKIFIVNTLQELSQPDTIARCDFYFNKTGVPIEMRGQVPLKSILFHGPIFLRGPKRSEVPLVVRVLNRVFDVDEMSSYMEAWHWHYGLEYLIGASSVSNAREKFTRWKSSLPANLSKAYVFGTGPSLARALSRDWSDGYRIVCNTIVRDAELWHHISPHAIVAGDALYHFGPAPFAVAFRRDLVARLRESPTTIFIYPAFFDAFLREELAEFRDRLLPIPQGRSNVLHTTIAMQFRLPIQGNVLNLLLLPIACSLSKHVCLWGFDGRAPADKLFWANSNKHSYPELMDSLRTSSPAFFDELVPKEDPEKYVRDVHGDLLAHCLSEAEKDGYKFEMLHETWTPTLQKYYR